MIEIKKSEYHKEDKKFNLFIDGVLVEKASVSVFGAEGGEKGLYYAIMVYDRKVGEKLMEYRLTDLPPLEYLEFRYQFSDLGLIDYVGINTPWKQRPYHIITFGSNPNLANWKRPYSFETYCDEMLQAAMARTNHDVKFDAHNNDGVYLSSFELEFVYSSLTSPILNEFARYADVVRKLHEEVEQELGAAESENSVSLSFDFPKGVKVPCEQYLLYFVEFLRDLGIEATSELRHEAGHALFSVKPTDQKEALDKIHYALEVYLKLPASPVSDFPESSEDALAIQRLSANIHHLKGQLVLAQAVIQMKDATIQLHQQNLAQHKVITGEVMIESLKRAEDQPDNEDKEKLLGGTVALTQHNFYGVEVSLAEIYRRLKSLFSEEK